MRPPTFQFAARYHGRGAAKIPLRPVATVCKSSIAWYEHPLFLGAMALVSFVIFVQLHVVNTKKLHEKIKQQTIIILPQKEIVATQILKTPLVTQKRKPFPTQKPKLLMTPKVIPLKELPQKKPEPKPVTAKELTPEKPKPKTFRQKDLETKKTPAPIKDVKPVAPKQPKALASIEKKLPEKNVAPKKVEALTPKKVVPTHQQSAPKTVELAKAPIKTTPQPQLSKPMVPESLQRPKQMQPRTMPDKRPDNFQALQQSRSSLAVSAPPRAPARGLAVKAVADTAPALVPLPGTAGLAPRQNSGVTGHTLPTASAVERIDMHAAASGRSSVAVPDENSAGETVLARRVTVQKNQETISSYENLAAQNPDAGEVVIATRIIGHSDRIPNLKREIIRKAAQLPDRTMQCTRISGVDCQILVQHSANGPLISIHFFQNGVALEQIRFEIFSKLERKIPEGLTSCTD